MQHRWQQQQQQQFQQQLPSVHMRVHVYDFMAALPFPARPYCTAPQTSVRLSPACHR